MALLTHGVNWRFHSTQSAGTYAELLVSTFDIETDSLDEVAVRLERYLSYANTRLRTHNQKITEAAMQMALKKVWAQRSYRMAIRRQSLRRSNRRSMRLRLL